MITKYFDFFKKYRLNEALSLEQSNERAEKFIYDILKARALFNKKITTKTNKLKELGLTSEQYDILRTKENPSEEDTKKLNSIQDAIKETKLDQNEEVNLKKSVVNNPFLFRVKKIVDSIGHPEWLYAFIKLFYFDFPNFKIDMNKDLDKQKVRNLLGPYTYVGDDFVWNRDENNREVFALIGDVVNQLKNTSKETLNKVLTNLEGVVYSNKQKEEAKKETGAQSGADMASNDIRDLEKSKNAKALLTRLPTGVRDENGEYIVPNLLKEFEELPEDSQLKKNIISRMEVLAGLLAKDYSFKPQKKILTDIYGKPVINKETGKPVFATYYPSESTFPMRLGTSVDPQKDKSLEDVENGFLRRVNNAIETLGNVGMKKLFTEVSNINNKLGENNGVDIVYNNDNDDNIIVLKVKSHAANNYLHNQSHGKLMLTGHCIAYDSKDYWNSIVGDNSYRKLYYVYNFNLDIRENAPRIEGIEQDNLFPFGLLVEPDPNNYKKVIVNSSHAKNDDGIKSKVKDIIKEFGLDFDKIFLPASEEEIKFKEKSKNASKTLADGKLMGSLTIEDVKELVDDYGADVNYDGGEPLINALKSSRIDLVKFLIERGANPNLGNAIEYATTFEEVKLLYTSQIPIYLENKKESELLKSWIERDNLEAVKFLIENGVSPKNGNPIKYTNDFVMMKLLCELGASPLIVNITSVMENIDQLKYLLSKNVIIQNDNEQFKIWQKLNDIASNIDKNKLTTLFDLLGNHFDLKIRTIKAFQYAILQISNDNTKNQFEYIEIYFNELKKKNILSSTIMNGDTIEKIIEEIMKSTEQVIDDEKNQKFKEKIKEHLVKIKQIINNYLGK
jgi:hypothetical protein